MKLVTLSIRSLAVTFALIIFITLSFFSIYSSDNDSNAHELSDRELSAIEVSKTPYDAPPKRSIINNIPYAEYQSSFGPLANSLRGTYVPIHLVIAPDGQLVITASIKTMIEYFLSANGEESIELIKNRIEEVFDRNLKEPAKSQGKAVLAQYFDYKQALVEIETQLADSQALSMQGADYQTVLAERREARISYLDQEVYDAFYLKEDSQDNYTVAMLALNRNTELSAEEKQQQGIELITLLPAEEQVHKYNEYQRQTLQQDVSEARVLGASDEDIYQMRTQVYDADTAERFASRDEEKRLWDKRFSNYRQQRQVIMESEGLTQADKYDEVLALQKDLFSHNEQRRLSTLDRMEDNSL